MKDVNKTKEQLPTEMKSPRRQISLPKRTKSDRTAKEPLKNTAAKSYQHQKETEALLEAARAIMRHQNFRDAAQSIFDICKNFTGATSGYVALLSKDGTENEVLFLDAGRLPCTVDQSLPMPIRGLRGEAYRTVKTVYDNNFSKSEWMRFIPEGHVTLENVVFAPLVIAGKAVGLIGLANKPGGFTENDASLVSAMGEFASVALRNSRTVESLTNSEERYRALFDHSLELVYLHDFEGNFIDANDAALNLLGYKRQEISSLNFASLLSEEQIAKALEVLQELKDTSVQREITEFKLKRKDGNFVYVETKASVIYHDGKPYAIQGIGRDITERKQAEEKMKESEEKFRSLVESTSDWIWEVNLNGVYTYASPKVKELLGYEPEEVIGKTPFDFMPVEEANRIANIFKDIVAAGKAIERLENTCWHKNGHLVILETSGVPVFDNQGKSRGYRGVDRDITERKKMQDSLIITDRLAALGNMAGGFAHELNNPLTSIIGYSQLLLDKKDLPQDVRSDLTGIYEEAQRASEVIKDFMVFALRRPQQKQPSDINDLIKGVLKLRKHAHRKNNITVKTNFDPELPLVTVGPVQMQQVFLDIIINAEYFMLNAHEKGTLTITTEKTKDVVRASFSDNGPGISPENVEQIFNPFFTTKEIGQGIGLGLSICHSIVTEHGGKIYVKSEPGKGATFVVELPINNK